MPPDPSDDPTATAPAPPAFAVERIDGNRAGGLLLLCDHATNRIPAAYGDLGLPPAAFARHIAYDIGALALSRRLAALAGAPLLFTGFSRLLIDPNRGEDDPTLVMRLSDGAIVPGNRLVDKAERDRRIAAWHRPYHDAIAAELDAMMATGVVPAVVSLHSYTPAWKGVPRPWQAGILWDVDDRLARPLIDGLAVGGDILVGDNEPYDGALADDTLFRHATRRGLANVLVEVRQDLIADPADAAAWGDRLWAVLAPLLADPRQHRVERYGSRAGPVLPDDPRTRSG